MRILDIKNDKALRNIGVYFTREEAKALIADLRAMLETSEKAYHVHFCDLQYEHEMTMAIYDEEDISLFDDRSKKLIQCDE